MTKYLVVGDGNFSFSLSLSKKYPAKDGVIVVATSYDTHQQVITGPKVAENVTELVKSGVTVLYEVDATALSICVEVVQLGPKYDQIIFNFPHTGGKSNIKKNRTLLKDFFISAVGLLEKDGSVCVSLCKGQGGTPVDCCKRGYENSWKVVEMAAEAGLILSNVEPFKAGEFPSYVPTGYRGQEKEFVLDGALRHTFVFPGISPSLYPPSYTHDVSFWSSQDGGVLDESRLREVVRIVTLDYVRSVECINTYRHPHEQGRVSYCYRLLYCSLDGALSRTHAAQLQLQLRDALCKELGVEVR